MKVDINKIVVNGIIEYCEKRNYKCKGCNYSINKLLYIKLPFSTCIFENCPCDWKKYYKED